VNVLASEHVLDAHHEQVSQRDGHRLVELGHHGGGVVDDRLLSEKGAAQQHDLRAARTGGAEGRKKEGHSDRTWNVQIVHGRWGGRTEEGGV
jgi:hypothetical protein